MCLYHMNSFVCSLCVSCGGRQEHMRILHFIMYPRSSFVQLVLHVLYLYYIGLYETQCLSANMLAIIFSRSEHI